MKMEEEQLRKEAFQRYPMENGTVANRRLSLSQQQAFIAGAEWEAEREKQTIVEIKKRVSILENSGSNSKSSEKLSFKELDTLKWVLKLLSPPKTSKQ